MKTRAFSIQDFSGGLNTAAEESLVPPNMSPSMRNVDVLDSRAIRRRTGYRDVTQVGATSITALMRFYPTSGAKLWVAAMGDGVYVRQDGVSDVPTTTLEAEGATVSGSTTTFSPDGYNVSGGSVSRVTGSATYTIPYSTRLVVRGALEGATMSLDGGAAVLATGYTHTFDSMAATSHTLKVVPPVRNSTLLRMRPSGDGKTRIRYRALPVDTSADAHTRLRVALRLYDRLPSQQFDMFLRVIDTANTDNFAWIGIYQHPTRGGSYTNYLYRDSVNKDRKTLKARSTGFTEVSFALMVTMDSDGVGAAITPRRPRVDATQYDFGIAAWSVEDISTVRVEIWSRKHGDGTFSCFADSYRVNDALIDDFYDLSQWSADGTSTTYVDDVIDESPLEYTGDTQTYVDVDSFTYSAFGNFTDIGTITASASNVGMAVMRDRVYFGTELDDVRYTTGSVSASVSASGTTKPGFLIEFKRRLFSSGTATDSSLLNYTEVDAPDDWTGGGSIRLAGRDSGAECTGLVAWDNYLFYFASSRIYVLDTTGTSDQWVSKMLHGRYGCIAPKSLTAAANGLIFLSDDAVRSYGYMPNIMSDDGSGILLLSKNITPTIDSITNKDIACAAVYKNRYWLSCALDGASSNNAILLCDLEKRNEDGQPPWMRYDIGGITCFETTRGDEYGLFAGTEDGTILELDHGDTDNGQVISMTYQLPPLPIGGYETEKHFRHVHVAARSSTDQDISVIPSTDDVHGQEVTIPVSSGTDVSPARRVLAARGRYIKARIESDGANQPVTVSGITFTYRPRPRMR